MTLTSTISMLSRLAQDGSTPPGSSPSFHELLKNLGLDEGRAAAKGALTLVVLFVALVASRYLANRASRVPVPVDGWSIRDGKLTGKVVEREGDASTLLGRLTGFCIWIAAVVALVFIWVSDLNLGSQARTMLLGWLSGLGWHLGISLVVFACALGVGGVAQKSFVSALGRSRLNRNLKLLGGRIVYLTIVVIAIVIVLSIWGTGIVLPVALIGALSVALSFALQDVLKNLVAGVYLLVEHPFVLGDRITVATFTGEIKDIQIRYTALVTDDDELVLVPNSILFSSAVINLSEANRKRGSLTVTVPALEGADLDRTEEQIRQALRQVRNVLLDPEPQVLLSKAAAGKMDIQVTFWISREDTGQSAAIYAEVMEQIRTQVQDAEIAVLDSAISAA